jgi:putative ABC transport system substrate-binding protein
MNPKLLWLLTAILLALPLRAEAQQPGKMTRVGFLGTGPAPTPATPYAPLREFRQGLDELGYVDGRDVVIETRWAGGRIDQLRALAAELVRLKVDIIVGVGAVVGGAAKSATTAIPVVIAVVIDPVEAGLIANLERPGGNVTGLTTFDPQEARKKLELLKEVVPGLARVAILGDQALRDTKSHLMAQHEEQARALGLQPQSLKIAGASPDLQGVFQAMERERADALLVLELPATVAHRKRIGELAAQHRLPTLFAGGSSDAGGLLGYGTRVTKAARRLAAYVDRIVKGAQPADLPFEVVVHPELIVNLKTAQEIGVTIPPNVLARADRVIR